jgi:HD-GYP domain-containing protein (c-di-GMP phosphodiesterase class II)
MTHARPYRPARPAEEALAELERGAGTHFDPRCVEGFLSLMGDPVARSLLGLPEPDS